MKLFLALFLFSLTSFGAGLSDTAPFRNGDLAEIHLSIAGLKLGKPVAKLEEVYFDFRAPNTMVAEAFYSVDLTEGEKQEVRNYYTELIEEELKDMKVTGAKIEIELNLKAVDPKGL